VLTRVPGTWPPILAGDQTTVVIGVQKTRSRMRVLLVTTSGRSIAARLSLPDGYLAQDGPERLVVSVPNEGSFPLEPRYDVGLASAEYPGVGASPVHDDVQVSEYSARGRLLRRFGPSHTQPLVSGGHIVVSAIAADGSVTLTQRSLTSGVARPLIGFSDPGRVLMATEFTWPILTFVDTTSATLPDGEFTCTSGPFLPATAPTLVSLNMIGAPFTPAPTTPPLPTPAQYLAQCGTGPPP
jgi:hypothetical protein